MTFALPFLISPLFFLQSHLFLYPALDLKMIYFSFLAFCAAGFLICRKKLLVPENYIFSALVCLALSALYFAISGSVEVRYWAGYYLSALILTLFLAQLSMKDLNVLLKSIFTIATIQAMLIWLVRLPGPLSHLLPDLWIEGSAVGFLGNSEFFAALIGFSLLIQLRLNHKKIVLVISSAILLAALVASGSKGTLAISFAVVAFRFVPKRATLLIGLPILGAIV
jgi:hypothetical protein